MRVIPLTSILSHKGRGRRSPNLDDTLNLDVKELFKHTVRAPGSTGLGTEVGPKITLPEIPG